jgi:CheY-like chemotaxis protein
MMQSRFLVVEGDSERRRALAEALAWAGYAGWAGCDVREFATATEALRSMKAAAPDALLLGDGIPPAEAAALLERCRADGVALAFAPRPRAEGALEGRRGMRRAAALLVPLRRVADLARGRTPRRAEVATGRSSLGAHATVVGGA